MQPASENVMVFLNIGYLSSYALFELNAECFNVSFCSIVHDFFLSSNFRKRRVSIPKFNGAMRCCLCVTFQLAKRFGPDRLAGQRLTILHRSSLISRAVTGLGFSIFLDKFAQTSGVEWSLNPQRQWSDEMLFMSNFPISEKVWA